MSTFRSVLARSTTVTAALVVAATTAGPAMASGHPILHEDLQGTFPLTDPVNPSPVIAGVSPGGAPWVVAEGSQVRVREDGRITVDVKGLVIPGRVPGNPVLLMAANLVCDDMVIDSTQPFAVLVRNATNPAALGSYFAVAADH